MNLGLRLALVGGGIAAAVWATGGIPMGASLVVAASGSGLCLAALASAQRSALRPFSDAAAWAGAAAVVWALGGAGLADLATALQLAGAALLLAIGLHVPVADAPRMRIIETLTHWCIVGALATLVACLPLLWSRGGVIVLDPLTATGLALRLSATAATLALAASAWALWRGRRVPVVEIPVA